MSWSGRRDRVLATAFVLCVIGACGESSKGGHSTSASSGTAGHQAAARGGDSSSTHDGGDGGIESREQGGAGSVQSGGADTQGGAKAQAGEESTASGGSEAGNGGTQDAGASGQAHAGSGGTVLVPFGGSSGVDSCTSSRRELTAVSASLEFLVDTSGSMLEAPGAAAGMPTQGATKWELTRDALTQAFANMTQGTETGLIFYPNMTPSSPFGMGSGGMAAGGARGGSAGGAGSGGTSSNGSTTGVDYCIKREVAVPLARLDAVQRQKLLAALQAKQPEGKTPTHDAYRFALDTLQAAKPPGNQYVVLITDGAPTYSLGCLGDGASEVDPFPIVAEAASALSQRGIKTFVVGSPGSEFARNSLSMIASMGGTARPGCSDVGPIYCHLDMTQAVDFSAALTQALNQIATQTASCSYALEAPSGQAIDYTKVNVAVTSSQGGTQLPLYVAGTDCDDGWQYSADQKQVMLCPKTCARVQADAAAKVEVVLGCATQSR